MCLVLDGDTKFYHTIREEVTLASFRGLFESYKQAVLTAKAINVCCSVVTIKGPKKITKASRPRGKKESEDEKNFKDLVKALFGVNPGHCAEGAWTAEASDVMRRRPDYVPKFAADRALMEKVLGDPLFLPTPCTYVCPFASAVCTKPTRRQNRFGGMSQMIKHLDAVHSDNPAAMQLKTRLRVMLKNKRLTVEQLDARAPLVQREEEGFEQLRRPADAVASEDMFTFDFDMHSDEHREWLTATGTI